MRQVKGGISAEAVMIVENEKGHELVVRFHHVEEHHKINRNESLPDEVGQALAALGVAPKRYYHGTSFLAFLS